MFDRLRLRFGRNDKFLLFSHHKCASKALRGLVEELGEKNGLSFAITQENARPILNNKICYVRNSEYCKVHDYLHVPAVHILRSPFGIIQSAYFSHLRTHPVSVKGALPSQRKILNSTDQETGLFLTLAFCERTRFFDRDHSGPLSQIRTWNYYDERVVTLRMEDFENQMVTRIRSAVAPAGQNWKWPSDEKYSFEALSGGRAMGEIDENSHYRAGSKGYWRQLLPSAIVNYVREHYRDLLERFYPEDLLD